MPVNDDQIRALLERPSESLQVEIKTWLDTTDPLGIAKLVKAAFAIRNRNGGFGRLATYRMWGGALLHLVPVSNSWGREGGPKSARTPLFGNSLKSPKSNS